MNVIDLSGLEDVYVLAGARCVQCAPLPVFSDEVCAFLADLSRNLLSDVRAKRYPDVVSFAYWCRKANVRKEREIRGDSVDGRLGRGFAFHISPGNVPVNFAFSYAFSLLAGNATVVRCPSRVFDQVEIILSAIRLTMEQRPIIEQRSAFVTYPSSGKATEKLSAISDVRVIWGGDHTVASIRALPSKPRCVDIAFADRYSIAMLSAEAVCSLDAEGLIKLARGFYNDTYLMDQNACSSPQAVLWVGRDAEIERAQGLFWGAVHNEALNRYDLQAAVSVNKHVQLCGDIIRGIVVSADEEDGLIVRSEIANDQALSTDMRGVGGYYYEKTIESLSDISADVTEKYQTLVYFGFEADVLRNKIIEYGMLGIDRIAPIGKALDIGLVWDGFDLINSMSRIIETS